MRSIETSTGLGKLIVRMLLARRTCASISSSNLNSSRAYPFSTLVITSAFNACAAAGPAWPAHNGNAVRKAMRLSTAGLRARHAVRDTLHTQHNLLVEAPAARPVDCQTRRRHLTRA